MKRSFLEDAKPRKKPKIEIDRDLEDEDSNSSITTPDLLSDEESRYASALIGDVELSKKPQADTELRKPVIELETALASISGALAEDSQSVELDVSGIEKSVSELASVLAPMAEKAQLNLVRNEGTINISEIVRSVSEITNALAPLAKENQSNQEPLESQVKVNVPEKEKSSTELELNVPEIEKSVTELVAALVPMAPKKITAKEVKADKQPVELDVPEIERSVTELSAVLVPKPEDTSTNGKIEAQKTPVESKVPEIHKSESEHTTALTSLDPPIGKDAQPNEKNVDKEPQEAKIPNQPQKMPDQPKENQQEEQVETVTKPEAKIDQAELLTQQTIPPSLPKNIVRLDDKPVNSVDDGPQSVELMIAVPKLPLVDLSTSPTPHQDEKPNILTRGKPDSLQFLANSPPPAIEGISNKSDTKEGHDCIDVIPATKPQQNMLLGNSAEKAEVPATSCPSIVSNKSYTNKSGGGVEVSLNAPPQETMPSGKPAEKADVPVTSCPSIMSDKSDEKKSDGIADVKPKILPQEALPQVELAEKGDVSPTSCASIVSSQAASTDINSKDVILRAVKEDLVRAYQEILKVEGGGISDERLGSLLLWLGIPKVSVNRHVRRIIRRKRKSGKPSRQTSLKNILRYFNYVLA